MIPNPNSKILNQVMLKSQEKDDKWISSWVMLNPVIGFVYLRNFGCF